MRATPYSGFEGACRYGVRHNGAFELRFFNWVLTLGNAADTPNAAAAALRAASDKAAVPALVDMGNHVRDYVLSLPLRPGTTPLKFAPDYESWLIEAMSHGDYDDFWKNSGSSVIDHLAEYKDIPVYHVTGWYDSWGTPVANLNFGGGDAHKTPEGRLCQYLRCPRSYRYRYVDGWVEKESKANMIFGRCFEKALAAYFRREDATAALFKDWGAYHDTALDYTKGDSWDKLVHQGVHLLEMFARGDRIRIPHPEKNLQLKMVRALPGGSEFVAYIDAIGEIDGQRFLIDWKTTGSRYTDEPEGLLSLDPQLICYSWITGIPAVALVVFVRKRLPEIQCLKASITEEQREEFGRLVSETASQIEAGQFLPHSGIRFPMNGCTSCPYLGLCLGRQPLIDAKLIRRPGASDFDCLDLLE